MDVIYHSKHRGGYLVNLWWRWFFITCIIVAIIHQTLYNHASHKKEHVYSRLHQIFSTIKNNWNIKHAIIISKKIFLAYILFSLIYSILLYFWKLIFNHHNFYIFLCNSGSFFLSGISIVPDKIIQLKM